MYQSFTEEEKDYILAFCGFILISNLLIKYKNEAKNELEQIENDYEMINRVSEIINEVNEMIRKEDIIEDLD